MTDNNNTMLIKAFDDPDEKIFRAVRPWPLFWDSDARISSAVFDLRQNEDGVSFDRADGRSDRDCCIEMHKRKLEGKIVSLKVQQCSVIEELSLRHTPIYNPFHSELCYLTSDEMKLKQIKHQLALCAKIEPY